MATYKVAVIGGGIVGLATARALLERNPLLRLVVLEKERQVAAHQTGHNSGVIHSGIYYRPGSLKASLCVEGVRRMTSFAKAHGIRYERCGKVIVATSPTEAERLEELYQRGTANGVTSLRKISADELRDLEPHVRGVAALHAPETGIIDYQEVARAMAADLQARGSDVLTGREVLGAQRDGQELVLQTTGGDLRASFVINCAGLYADVIARKMGVNAPVRIIPFRGEYYVIRPERHHLVRGLVYPVPDPQFPFLGVHFTRTVRGEVEAGPNAVLALAREGYSKGVIRPRELWETLTYPGFISMASKYWRVGLYESYRSFCKKEFARALGRMVPEIQPGDLAPGGAGVRAQAVGVDGRLIDDFYIEQSERAIHVLNAPSPAATASLAIGEYVARAAVEAFSLAEVHG